ncbi:uncharacterized protein ATC70_011049 [Mucor velutinosus]|uniref:WKF domain-containing protein n=1 Tax=Mucor velutinosus TaxID=708070 RepID=A0AAN7DFM5_9FUNG|nr:hypothetical protein ATC70_011049 [Mucor velutinosus]
MAEKVATKPAIKKTATKTMAKKVPSVKPTAKTTTPADATATATSTNAEKPKLTQGQKLLKAMTAQKAAKKALMKGVAVTHVSFDDDGNEANVETVIQKTAPPAKVVNPKKTNKNRPAVKKPEPIKNKKRSADEMEDDANKEKKEEEDKKDNKKPPKKAKKAKKSKLEIEEMKKDNKQEEALAYVRLFVNDRDSWKFKKVQQIWLLSNLYEIPEDEFDNVLEYLKDLQGSAREKTKQEAKDKIPAEAASAPAAVSNTLTGYANVNAGNDDDDFDAEKLLAQATAAPVVQQEVANDEEKEEEEEESDEVKRARLIVKTLS